MPPHDPPDDEGPPDAPAAPTSTTVDVGVVDRLMAAVGALIHDQPVQGLVAGKLMVESAQHGGDGARALLDRGAAALDRAAEQARTIMWALDRDPVPEGANLPHLLGELLDRAAAPAGMDVVVAVAPDVPAATLSTLVHAAHDVVADVALRGGVLHRISVRSAGPPGAVVAEVETSRPTDGAGSVAGPIAERPWLALAAARVGAAGGTLSVDLPAAGEGGADGPRVVHLTVPMP